MFLCVAWITDYSRSLRAASAAGPPGDDLSQSGGTNSPSPLEDPRIATNRCLDARAKRRHEPTPMPEPPEPTRLAEPAWLATYPMSCLRAPRSRPRADPLQNQGVDRASVYRRTATPSTAPSRGAGVERRAGLLANAQDRIDTGQRIGKVADRSRAQQAVCQLLDSFGHRVDEAALPPRGARRCESGRRRLLPRMRQFVRQQLAAGVRCGSVGTGPNKICSPEVYASALTARADAAATASS